MVLKSVKFQVMCEAFASATRSPAHPDFFQPTPSNPSIQSTWPIIHYWCAINFQLRHYEASSGSNGESIPFLKLETRPDFAWAFTLPWWIQHHNHMDNIPIFLDIGWYLLTERAQNLVNIPSFRDSSADLLSSFSQIHPFLSSSVPHSLSHF